MRGLAVVSVALLVAVAGVTSAEPLRHVAAEEKPLKFVLKQKREAGGRTAVKLRNRGEDTYIYNPYYEACEMVFRERSIRRFIIPEGTHCDLVAKGKIEPGETVTLFKWDFDECTKDEWGCVKSKDLPAGRYLMRGWFKVKGDPSRERVTKRFRIVEP